MLRIKYDPQKSASRANVKNILRPQVLVALPIGHRIQYLLNTVATFTICVYGENSIWDVRRYLFKLPMSDADNTVMYTT